MCGSKAVLPWVVSSPSAEKEDPRRPDKSEMSDETTMRRITVARRLPLPSLLWLLDMIDFRHLGGFQRQEGVVDAGFGEGHCGVTWEHLQNISMSVSRGAQFNLT